MNTTKPQRTPGTDRPSPGTDLPSAEKTAIYLAAFARRLMGYEHGESLRVIEQTGLSLPQLKVILELGPGGSTEPCHLGELAESLGISTSAISRAVDGLVRIGFVTRVEDFEDRRRRRIAVTEKGSELINRLVAGRMAGFRRFSEDQDPQTRRVLIDAVDSVIEPEEIASTREMMKEAGIE